MKSLARRARLARNPSQLCRGYNYIPHQQSHLFLERRQLRFGHPDLTRDFRTCPSSNNERQLWAVQSLRAFQLTRSRSRRQLPFRYRH